MPTGELTAGAMAELEKFVNWTTEPSQQMFRFNSGKVPLSLVPSSYDRYCAYGLWYGARKYEANNWRKAGPWTKVADSLLRHLQDWRDGEDIDPESGLPHLCHIACNVAFLIEFYDKDLGHDDRFRYGEPSPARRQLAFREPTQRQEVH